MPRLLDVEFTWLAYLVPLLGHCESRALSATARELHRELGSQTRAWAQQKWHWIQRLYHPVIQDLLGGPYAMMRMPRLGWQPYFRGGTGYIDGIAPSDMDCPVMLGRGAGPRGPRPVRPYVALRTRGASERRDVTVLFQRYSGDPGTWASSDHGGIMTECGHFMVDGVLKHELLAFNVGNLLAGKQSIMRFTKFVGQDIHSVPRWLE